MKYILTAAMVSLSLAACTEQKSETQTAGATDNNLSTQTTIKDTTVAATDKSLNNAEQTINFTGPQDLSIMLKSADNFETAQLSDNSGKVYELKRVVSGSGIKLANEQGVAIHFKEFNGVMEGTVELVKDKAIEIKEFKNN